MAQQQENPIYWDQHASRFNLTLIFSLAVAVLGLFTAAGGFPFLVILGLGMAAYSWFTTPRQYLLYRDSMVIVYGLPRTRHISFAEISHVELLALPLGERLRIRMMSGSRLMLMMRDPGAFRGHLEDALSRYHGEQSGAAYMEGAVLPRGSEAAYDSEVEYGAETAYDQAGYEEARYDEAGYDQAGYEEAGYDTEPVAEAEAVNTLEDAPGAAQEAATSNVYSEAVEQGAQATEISSDGSATEGGFSTSGSYTESAEPDYSGEGRPAYGAEVDFETSGAEPGSTEEDTPERPQSPY